MPGAGWSSLASWIVAVTVAIATVDHGDGRRPELWSLTVAVASGVGAGLLAAGTGGRLAMRLLAVTARADAQGRITEAEQVVGRISVDSTLGSSTSKFTLLNVLERHPFTSPPSKLNITGSGGCQSTWQSPAAWTRRCPHLCEM